MHWTRLIWSAVIVVAMTTCLIAGARADWELDVSVEEGVTLMGGPLTYRLASPSNVEQAKSLEAMPRDAEVDGVTGASIDAITSASRVSHAGGVHLNVRRGDTGSMTFGLEYNHYRFDLDYELGRASMDIVSLRLLALVRLTLARFRGSSAFTFGFGGYLELALFDRAELSGGPVDIDVAPAGFGIAVDFHLHPFRFTVSNGRGTLIPGLFLRGYRGLVTQLRDELGSDAPLVSTTIGFEMRYRFQSEATQGTGRSGR
jgi:hypothetical protein